MSASNEFSKSYLSTSVFVSRAYASLERLSGDEVLLRQKDGKKLVEEIIPIAAFLKYFEIPGRRVNCKYFPGNQNYDARIKIRGNEVRRNFLKESYFLEVTSAVSAYNYLERESLSIHGAVFGGGKIHSEGLKHQGNRRIISEAVAEDGDAVVIKASDWIRECLKAKAGKAKYLSLVYCLCRLRRNARF